MGFVPQVFHHDDEFVATQSRNRIAKPHIVLDPPRHFHQQLVADIVAARVVERFEVVEVEEQHAPECPLRLLPAKDWPMRSCNRLRLGNAVSAS